MSPAAAVRDAATPASDRSAAFELLLDLAGALQKHATYPAGHPLLLAAVDRALAAVPRALLGREALVVGVSPGRVFVDETELPAGNLLLRDLTLRLHRRDLAGFRVLAGVTRAELLEVLGVIAGESSAGETAAAEPRLRWEHVRLVPLSYDRLELADDAIDTDGPDGGSADLWSRLTRAALDADEARGGPDDATGVARAIEARVREPDGAGEVFVHFAALVREAGRSGGDGAAIRRHLAELVTALDPAALDALLAAAPGDTQGGELVRQASRALSAPAALRLLLAERRRTSRRLPPALDALLVKLAALGEHGPAGVRGRAQRALRAELRALADAPIPLEGEGDGAESVALDGECALMEPGDAERLLRTSVALAVVTPATLRAADDLLAAGETGLLLSIADHPGVAASVAAALRDRVLSPATLSRVLAQTPPDLDGAARLVQALGDAAVGPVLDAFQATDDRPRQRRLAALLQPCAAEAGRQIGTRLPAATRRVQRALLTLLQQLETPVPPTAERFVRHPDPELRATAARLLLRRAPSPRLTESLLANDDPHLQRLALRATRGASSSRTAIARLRTLAASAALPPVVRAMAVHALADDLEEATLHCLLELVRVRRTLLRRARLAARTPVVTAALHVLARRWHEHADVREVLALAAATGDGRSGASAHAEVA